MRSQKIKWFHPLSIISNAERSQQHEQYEMQESQNFIDSLRIYFTSSTDALLISDLYLNLCYYLDDSFIDAVRIEILCSLSKTVPTITGSNLSGLI